MTCRSAQHSQTLNKTLKTDDIMSDKNISSAQFIYKICSAELWQQACELGQFEGAPIDLEDGFIHFSDATQLKETAAKHFAGQSNLKLLQVDTAALEIVWEVSRGGQLFPHLYDTLPLCAVVKVWDLPVGGDGLHQLPTFS